MCYRNRSSPSAIDTWAGLKRHGAAACQRATQAAVSARAALPAAGSRIRLRDGRAVRTAPGPSRSGTPDTIWSSRFGGWHRNFCTSRMEPDDFAFDSAGAGTRERQGLLGVISRIRILLSASKSSSVERDSSNSDFKRTGVPPAATISAGSTKPTEPRQRRP